MKENITTIKVIKEEDYDVNIDILAADLADYLEEALNEQFDGDDVDEILENEANCVALLAKVGKVWQDNFRFY